MTTRDHFNEKKTPMTKTAATSTVMTSTTRTSTTRTSTKRTSTKRTRSADMNLINEALSRARMRSPQNSSEARRSARRIAMEARHQQARELGNLSQFGIR